jgi:hypothetical protein
MLHNAVPDTDQPLQFTYGSGPPEVPVIDHLGWRANMLYDAAQDADQPMIVVERNALQREGGQCGQQGGIAGRAGSARAT